MSHIYVTSCVSAKYNHLTESQSVGAFKYNKVKLRWRLENGRKSNRLSDCKMIIGKNLGFYFSSNIFLVSVKSLVLSL